jgi:hypothetical protein
MALPAFTAKTSLYRSIRSYRVGRARHGTTAALVVAQDTCGSCSCDPGQCCSTLGPNFCACKRCPPPSTGLAEPDTILSR